MKTTFSCLLIFISAVPGLWAGDNAEWKVGLAQVKITPRQPVLMSGYAGRNKPFEKVAGDLFVKAMVLEDAKGERAVLVTSDLLGFPAQVSEPICEVLDKKLGFKRSNILFNSSHTHAGPLLSVKVPVKGITGDGLREVEYTRDLQAKVVEAVTQAAAKLEPVKLSWSSGVVHFVMNRREFTPTGVILGVNPRGLADRGVPVLRIDGLDGKPHAILFGAAVHGTTLGPDNYQLCGDYAGFAQSFIEERFPKVQVMFMLGCAGDANPYPRGTMDLTRQHGETLGKEVCRVLEGKFKPVRGPLTIAFERADLPLATLTKEQTQKLAADKRHPQNFAAVQILAMLEKGEKPPTHYSCPFTVWQFGQDLTLAGLPGEVVVDYVAFLEKALGPNQLWVAGYCNDVFGYLPSARVLKEGGYETRGLYSGGAGVFDAGAEEVVVRKMRELAEKAGRKVPEGAQKTSLNDPSKQIQNQTIPAKPGPVITVSAVYTGATAKIVADCIAVPIENLVHGVENMASFSSRLALDGTYSLAVTFKPGVDLAKSLTLVQNRVALAMPLLPDFVSKAGLTVRKKSPGVLMLATLSSGDGRFDTLSLSNYAQTHLRDELIRLPGINDVLTFGQRDYILRINLQMSKLEAHKITALDVYRAIQGVEDLDTVKKVGKPKEKNQGFQITIKMGKLMDKDSLYGLVLKTDPQGRIVRLKDVADIQLDGDNQIEAFFEAKSAVVLAVYPFLHSDPLEVRKALKEKIARLRERLPEGMRLAIAFDFSQNLETPNRRPRQEYVILDLDFPAGISRERMREMLKSCEVNLRGVAGVEAIMSLPKSPFDLDCDRPSILVRLVANGDKPVNRDQLKQTIRSKLEQVGGVTVRFPVLSEQDGVLMSGYLLEAAIQGPKQDKVRALADKLTASLKKNNSLTDVWLNPDSQPQPAFYIDIDRDKVKKLGVLVTDIVETLKVQIGNVPEQFGRKWEIRIAGTQKEGKEFDYLKQLKIRNSDGKMVPLDEIVTMREVRIPKVIQRLNGREFTAITANPGPETTLAQARALIEMLAGEIREELSLSNEYRLIWMNQTSPK